MDKESKYVVNGLPYVGRNESHSKDERVSDQVVMLLLKPAQQREERDNRQLFHLNEVGHTVAKKQSQLTENSEKNAQRTCSGEEHARATSLHHTL